MSEQIKTFKYLKESGEMKEYEVLQLKDMGTAIEGISLGDLKEEEKNRLLEAHKVYLEVLEPFMKKSYRRFNKIGIKEIK